MILFFPVSLILAITLTFTFTLTLYHILYVDSGINTTVQWNRITTQLDYINSTLHEAVNADPPPTWLLMAGHYPVRKPRDVLLRKSELIPLDVINT